MVMQQLSQDMIDAGKELAVVLEARIDLRGALWAFMSDTQTWRYVICTPLVEKQGPLKAYAAIRKVLETVTSNETAFVMGFYGTFLVDLKEPLIQNLSKIISTSQGISAIRLTGNIVNNVLLEDAYIYMLNLQGKALRAHVRDDKN